MFGNIGIVWHRDMPNSRWSSATWQCLPCTWLRANSMRNGEKGQRNCKIWSVFRFTRFWMDFSISNWFSLFQIRQAEMHSSRLVQTSMWCLLAMKLDDCAIVTAVTAQKYIVWSTLCHSHSIIFPSVWRRNEFNCVFCLCFLDVANTLAWGHAPPKTFVKLWFTRAESLRCSGVMSRRHFGITCV